MKKMGTLIMALVFALVLAGCPSSGGGGSLVEPSPPVQTPDPGNGDGGFPIPVVGISLDKTTLTLNINQSSALTPTLSPVNASNKKVTWSSSNPAVATINSIGLVTAKAAGSAIITVITADGNKTASCVVIVTSGGTVIPTPPVQSRPVEGISLNKTSLILLVNQSDILTATLSPVNASNQTVTWSSSNLAVATVSGISLNALVTARAAGIAIITVTTADGNKMANCQVTVPGSDTGGNAGTN